MRKINECIIHCTAINKDLSIEDIRKMHVGQGWDDQSAASLIFDLQQIFGDLKISPHNKYSNKRCPVFDVSIIKGLIDGMEKLRTSYME